MFKRLLLILILAAITFFVYSKINPSGATALTDKIKQTYNKMLGKEELTGAVLTGDLLTGEFLTGGLENLSGDVNLSGAVANTGDLGIGDMNNTGDIVVEPIKAESTGTTKTTVQAVPSNPTSTTPTTTTKTSTTTPAPSSAGKTTTSNGGLSAQDKKDAESMSNLFK